MRDNFTGELTALRQQLTPALLSEFQRDLTDGSLSFEKISTRVGPEGAVTLALLAKQMTSPREYKFFLSPIFDEMSTAIDEHAPGLTSLQPLQEVGDKLLSENSNRFPAPYDDIGAVRVIPMFLGSERKLTALARMEVAFNNDRTPITFTLSAHDLVFFSASALKGLSELLALTIAPPIRIVVESEELKTLPEEIQGISDTLKQILAALSEY
jgi:hypothetical protein